MRHFGYGVLHYKVLVNSFSIICSVLAFTMNPTVVMTSLAA